MSHLIDWVKCRRKQPIVILGVRRCVLKSNPVLDEGDIKSHISTHAHTYNSVRSLRREANDRPPPNRCARQANLRTPKSQHQMDEPSAVTIPGQRSNGDPPDTCRCPGPQAANPPTADPDCVHPCSSPDRGRHEHHPTCRNRDRRRNLSTSPAHGVSHGRPQGPRSEPRLGHRPRILITRLVRVATLASHPNDPRTCPVAPAGCDRNREVQCKIPHDHEAGMR